MTQRLQQVGESAFAAFVRRRSDAQLERTFGTDRGMRLIFKGMERAFVPEKAGKFSGDVQYELTGPQRGPRLGRADRRRQTRSPRRAGRSTRR